MDVHYLQHVPFEGPAGLRAWADSRGHTLSGTRIDEGEDFPTVEEMDALVVLGGPMGVGDDYPWLAAERDRIVEALDAGVPVVGVCLGAQQLAAALGADVWAHEESEIGWFPVEATDAAEGTCFEGLPAEYPVLHWHGDTFALPEGATLTATGPACRNQAFVTGDGLGLGLQFHLEATPESVATLVEATETLPEGEWVQSRSALLAEDAPYEQLHEALCTLLDSFFTREN